jgi:hypothetical protein
MTTTKGLSTKTSTVLSIRVPNKFQNAINKYQSRFRDGESSYTRGDILRHLLEEQLIHLRLLDPNSPDRMKLPLDAKTNIRKLIRQTPEQNTRTTTVLSIRVHNELEDAINKYQDQIQSECSATFARGDILRHLLEEQLIHLQLLDPNSQDRKRRAFDAMMDMKKQIGQMAEQVPA